jgi:hypothetical protein
VKLLVSNRVVLVGAAVVGLMVPWAPAVRAALPGSVVPPLRDAVVDKSAQICSPNDHPEAGLQGDVPKAQQESGDAKTGYNCGLSLVGHAVLDGAASDDHVTRNPTGNANMAWSGDCAYVSGDGVAVIDVRNPRKPRHVRTLHGAGSDATIETLHAVDVPATPERAARHVLVTGKYGIGTPSPNMPMDVWDVSTCTQPKLLETVIWPENIHNLTISGNGRYVFATQPLQVVDIDPLFDGNPATMSVFLGNLSNATAFPLVPTEPGPDVDDGLPPELRDAGSASQTKNHSHEAWPTFDGTKLYLGGVTASSEVFTIVDITKWLQRDAANNPAGAPQVISQRSGRGHSVRTGTVTNGDGTKRRLVLHSEEAVFGTAKGCIPEKANPFAGPAEPYLMDITNESNPHEVRQFGLEINKAENCPAQLASGVDASSHYHDFDSESDTHFAVVSMWNAGVRLFDVRNPEHPFEVAYFNPADVGAAGKVVLDKAWGHVRYVPATGQLWFGTASGGFWVVELSKAVRDHFFGPNARNTNVVHPDGWAGTTGAPRLTAAVAIVDATPYYCTLGSVLAGTS